MPLPSKFVIGKGHHLVIIDVEFPKCPPDDVSDKPEIKLWMNIVDAKTVSFLLDSC